MVTPDYSRHEQDRRPGLLRELHQVLAGKPKSLRNLPETDYSALVKRRDLFSTQAEGGYVVGLPFGRHLRIFYEFEDVEPLRQDLNALLDDLGELAHERSGTTLMVLEFSDFPHRHRVDPILTGAEFDDPIEWSRLRVIGINEEGALDRIPALPDGITVRQATVADGERIAALEERVGGEGAFAPPLPKDFFADDALVVLAEVDGALAGVLRAIPGEKRSLDGEEFVVDPSHATDPITTALLRAMFEAGAQANKRSLTVRVALESTRDPVFVAFGFKPSEQGLTFLRSGDPEALRQRREERIAPRFKIGKIWGRY